mmetsp:Transcript_6027/g.23905  ORF Transcript_6027/g.23905 Transcript_6027/m.23905 type:complete len:344 (+) Transcript_6027:910-1941(+)
MFDPSKTTQTPRFRTDGATATRLCRAPTTKFSAPTRDCASTSSAKPSSLKRPPRPSRRRRIFRATRRVRDDRASPPSPTRSTVRVRTIKSLPLASLRRACVSTAPRRRPTASSSLERPPSRLARASSSASAPPRRRTPASAASCTRKTASTLSCTPSIALGRSRFPVVRAPRISPPPSPSSPSFRRVRRAPLQRFVRLRRRPHAVQHATLGQEFHVRSVRALALAPSRLHAHGDAELELARAPRQRLERPQRALSLALLARAHQGAAIDVVGGRGRGARSRSPRAGRARARRGDDARERTTRERGTAHGPSRTPGRAAASEDERRRRYTEDAAPRRSSPYSAR